MKTHHLPIFIGLVLFAFAAKGQETKPIKEFHLKATMLGYFAEDGARNPTLKAKKGQTVKITITNGELMTHDVAMEKLQIKSETIIEKFMSTSITFVAVDDDTYYCTVPGHRAAGMVGKFQLLEDGETEQIPGGSLPMKDGQTLNLNFETGNLDNWTAKGDAFASPLIQTDPSPLHGEEGPIFFEGENFLSSGGLKNYQLTGTLTSDCFEVTSPFAAFRVSGGALVDTRVELVLAETDEVIFSSTGQGRATLQPVVADLSPFLGK